MFIICTVYNFSFVNFVIAGDLKLTYIIRYATRLSYLDSLYFSFI